MMRRAEREQQDKLDDAASYDEVAATFERFTTRFSTRYARSIAAALQRHGGERFLDLGTGSGLLAREVAKACLAQSEGTAAHVVGVDLSQGMLAEADAGRENLDPSASAGLEFLRMDGENLAFADGHFDGIGSLFTLLHFPSPEQALAECFRVLKPGGLLVVGVGAGPSLTSRAAWGAAWSGLRGSLARRRGLRLDARESVLQALQLVTAGSVEFASSSMKVGQGDATTTHRLAASEVPALMRAAGFVLAPRRLPPWMGAEERFEDPEEFWAVASLFNSTARKRLAALSPRDRAGVRTLFVKGSTRVLAAGGELIYRHGIRLTAGLRPDKS